MAQFKTLALRDLQAILPVDVVNDVAIECGGRRGDHVNAATTISISDRTLLSLLKTLKQIISERIDSPTANLLARATAAHILHTQTVHPASGALTPEARLSTRQMQLIQTYIHANLERNVKNGDLARQVAMSPTQFARRFKASTGKPPHHFIVEMRVRHAAVLLAESSLSVGEVAARSGFRNSSHLSTTFRRFVKASPSVYRAHASSLMKPQVESISVPLIYSRSVVAEPSAHQATASTAGSPPVLTEFTIEQTSLRIDRNVELQASSQGLGWTDLFTAITYELPHDALHGTRAAVWLATAPTPHEIRRIRAGYRHERTLPKNAVSIGGAGDAIYDELTAPLMATHVYLRQQLVDEVADDFFKDGRERRQVMSSFGLDDAALQQLLTAIRLSLNDPQPNNQLKMDYLSQALAAYLLTKHSVLGPARDIRQMHVFNSREIARIVDYIDDNLSSNMSVADLAAIVGLRRVQFGARFRATTSMTPHQFVVLKRIRKARQLMADSRVDYAFVALLCGFASWSHLTTTFKRVMGLTPHEYRRQMGLASNSEGSTRRDTDESANSERGAS